jgi:hypothetical protein
LSDFNPVFLDEGEWPALNPRPVDTRVTPNIPAGSVTNDQLADGISPQKFQGIGAKYFNAAVQPTADGVPEFLSPDTKSFDEGGFWDSTDPTKLTAPYDGVYIFTAYADFVADADGNRIGKLYVNGVSQVVKSDPSVGGGNPTQVLMSVPIKLTAGDYVQFEVIQSAGGALNVNAGEDDNFISLVFLFPL